MTRRQALSLLAAGTTTAALASCVGPGSPEDDTITVGSKGFTESWIMGELYAQLLRARDYNVALKTNVGSTNIINTALTSGRIDLYPEYTGVIVVVLAGNDEVLGTAEQTYRLAKEYEASKGIALLEPTPFENKNAIAVTSEFAAKHQLSTISDLQGIGDFLYSTYPANVTGGQGYEGIVKNYDLPNMKLKTLSIGLNYGAIERGEIQAADVFTTDPQLLRSDLVVLEDNHKLFGFQNVSPAIREDTLARVGDDVPKALNQLSGLLTLEAMQAMNEASAINRLDPAQVAKKFLSTNNLI